VEAARGPGAAPSPALPRSVPTPMTRRKKKNDGAGSVLVSLSSSMFTLGRNQNVTSSSAT